MLLRVKAPSCFLLWYNWKGKGLCFIQTGNNLNNPMVLPTVLHLPCIITSFLIFMAQSQCKISGVVCVEGEMARAELRAFGCGWRQILNFTLHFCWTFIEQWNMKRIRDSSHPACLSSSKSIINFAYLNLLLTLIFRHNKWGCCLLKDCFQVLGTFMQKNHWITLLLWYTLHWMESCNCAPALTAAYQNGKMCCCAGCLLLFRKLHQVSKNMF